MIEPENEIKAVLILIGICVIAGIIIGFFAVRATRRDPTLLRRLIEAADDSTPLWRPLLARIFKRAGKK